MTLEIPLNQIGVYIPPATARAKFPEGWVERHEQSVSQDTFLSRIMND